MDVNELWSWLPCTACMPAPVPMMLSSCICRAACRQALMISFALLLQVLV